MTSDANKNGWWDLHLKKARGQELSAEEQQLYDAEIARHDQPDAANADLAYLKKLRADVSELARQNEKLRDRIADLEAQTQAIEKTLSKETRESLGVQE